MKSYCEMWLSCILRMLFIFFADDGLTDELDMSKENSCVLERETPTKKLCLFQRSIIVTTWPNFYVVLEKLIIIYEIAIPTSAIHIAFSTFHVSRYLSY